MAEKQTIPKEALDAVREALTLLNKYKDVLPGTAKAAIGILAAILGYGKAKESVGPGLIAEAKETLESLIKEEKALPAALVQAIKKLIAQLSALLQKYGFPYKPYYKPYYYKPYYYKPYYKPPAKREKTIRGFAESARILEAVDDEIEGLRWKVALIKAGLSKNRRFYPREVLESALPLFEGVKFFVNHATKSEERERPERSLEDFAGWFENARLEDDHLLADLHVLASHPIHEKLLELEARNALDKIGLSIRGQGVTRLVRENAQIVERVESITKITSVDAVTEPAAGGKFIEVLENTDEEGIAEMLEKLTLEELEELRPDLIEALVQKFTALEEEPTLDEVAEVTGESGEDERLEEVAQVLHELTLERCALLLERKLSESKLPEALKAKIKRHFEGKEFNEEELDAAINEERVVYAKLVEEIKPRAVLEVTLDERDKFAKALEGMIANEDIDGIPRFRSVIQAYCAFKGIRDPWAISKGALASKILRESAQYDSGLRESIETTDWAQVFGDSITRRLIKEYRIPMFDEWRLIVSDIRPLKDLRTQRVVRIGYYGLLPTVPQGGPYQPLASPSDEEATYTPAKKGGLEDYTWEALVNDDLGALQKIPQRLALAAKITLYQFVFDFLKDNPTIYDGVALFHANHGNLGSSALSSDALTDAKIAMRSQTALDSTATFLAIKPRYLVVPNELETLAYQLRNSKVEVTTGKDATVVNPHFETFDVIVCDYFTDSNNWYLVADPKLVPTIEIGFLDGRDEPELFTEAPNSGGHFTADKLRFKIRFVFGGAVTDYRGLYGSLTT